ncbi:hypothetical protein OAA81_03485 [Flavobacteriaceae bacterium]|nr:hypothetical protein [Flavobacteriaceae bacterium]
MKKVLIILILVSFRLSGQQNDPSKIIKSELNINLFSLLVFEGFELTYEKYIDNQSSYGISGFINLKGKNRFNDDSPFYYESYSITPFYRLYFGKNNRTGPFLEGFSGFSSGNYEDYEDIWYDYDLYGSEAVIKSYNTANIGISLGSKWNIKDKILFSTILGIGRSIGSANSPEFFPRISIALGIY